jgi:hypothetical protein
MAISKMTRESQAETGSSTELEDDLFNFGEPEIIPIELAPGKFLCLREPTASDLIEISKISDNKNISEVEATLQTICILHSPGVGERRLSLKDAKRLRPRQLKKIGEVIETLLGIESEDEQQKEL